MGSYEIGLSSSGRMVEQQKDICLGYSVEQQWKLFERSIRARHVIDYIEQDIVGGYTRGHIPNHEVGCHTT
jgi:hypothetical protein